MYVSKFWIIYVFEIFISQIIIFVSPWWFGFVMKCFLFLFF